MITRTALALFVGCFSTSAFAHVGTGDSAGFVLVFHIRSTYGPRLVQVGGGAMAVAGIAIFSGII
jgi:hypothetical protein